MASPETPAAIFWRLLAFRAANPGIDPAPGFGDGNLTTRATVRLARLVFESRDLARKTKARFHEQRRMVYCSLTSAVDVTLFNLAYSAGTHTAEIYAFFEQDPSNQDADDRRALRFWGQSAMPMLPPDAALSWRGHPDLPSLFALLAAVSAHSHIVLDRQAAGDQDASSSTIRALCEAWCNIGPEYSLGVLSQTASLALEARGAIVVDAVGRGAPVPAGAFSAYAQHLLSPSPGGGDGGPRTTSPPRNRAPRGTPQPPGTRGARSAPGSAAEARAQAARDRTRSAAAGQAAENERFENERAARAARAAASRTEEHSGPQPAGPSTRQDVHARAQRRAQSRSDAGEGAPESPADRSTRTRQDTQQRLRAKMETRKRDREAAALAEREVTNNAAAAAAAVALRQQRFAQQLAAAHLARRAGAELAAEAAAAAAASEAQRQQYIAQLAAAAREARRVEAEHAAALVAEAAAVAAEAEHTRQVAEERARHAESEAAADRAQHATEVHERQARLERELRTAEREAAYRAFERELEEFDAADALAADAAVGEAAAVAPDAAAVDVTATTTAAGDDAAAAATNAPAAAAASKSATTATADADAAAGEAAAHAVAAAGEDAAHAAAAAGEAAARSVTAAAGESAATVADGTTAAATAGEPAVVAASAGEAITEANATALRRRRAAATAPPPGRNDGRGGGNRQMMGRDVRRLAALTANARAARESGLHTSPWYEFDMSSWPPKGAELLYGDGSHFSWAFCPFLHDVARVSWPPHWTFSRSDLDPRWDAWVRAYQEAGNVDPSSWPADGYISAAEQEGFIDALVGPGLAGAFLQEYVSGLAVTAQQDAQERAARAARQSATDALGRAATLRMHQPYETPGLLYANIVHFVVGDGPAQVGLEFGNFRVGEVMLGPKTVAGRELYFVVYADGTSVWLHEPTVRRALSRYAAVRDGAQVLSQFEAEAVLAEESLRHVLALDVRNRRTRATLAEEARAAAAVAVAAAAPAPYVTAGLPAPQPPEAATAAASATTAPTATSAAAAATAPDLAAAGSPAPQSPGDSPAHASATAEAAGAADGPPLQPLPETGPGVTTTAPSAATTTTTEAAAEAAATATAAVPAEPATAVPAAAAGELSPLGGSLASPDRDALTRGPSPSRRVSFSPNTASAQRAGQAQRASNAMAAAAAAAASSIFEAETVSTAAAAEAAEAAVAAAAVPGAIHAGPGSLAALVWL